MKRVVFYTICLTIFLGATVASAQDAHREAIAVEFLERLYALPDNPRAASPAQNELMKKIAARVLSNCLKSFDTIRVYDIPKRYITRTI
jgi:hypothetical protein